MGDQLVKTAGFRVTGNHYGAMVPALQQRGTVREIQTALFGVASVTGYTMLLQEREYLLAIEFSPILG